MSQEILYTSAPRGLRQGSRGYCTVLATPGMSKTLVEQLESLSGYKHVFPPHGPEANRNPTNYSHLILTVGGRQCHVLSRIGNAGLDYTQRSNKVAHHVALEINELVPAGPARVLATRGFMEKSFEGEPRITSAGRQPPRGDVPAAVCRHWQKVTGDAGWAGVLADTAVGDRGRQAVIIFRPGMKLLPLFVDAMSLVPPEWRWDVSFSTYFTRLPSGLSCQWRGVLEGTEECKAARRLPRALILDLCRRWVRLRRARWSRQPAPAALPTGRKENVPPRPVAAAPCVSTLWCAKTRPLRNLPFWSRRLAPRHRMTPARSG